MFTVVTNLSPGAAGMAFLVPAVPPSTCDGVAGPRARVFGGFSAYSEHHLAYPFERVYFLTPWMPFLIFAVSLFILPFSFLICSLPFSLSSL